MQYLDDEELGPNFNSCTSCGLSNVLKPGDYCRACASTWRLPTYGNEYVVVTPGTLDAAVESSGLAKSYLLAKQEQCFMREQKYVVFFARGEWGEIVIHDRFYLPAVMFNLFEALGDHVCSDDCETPAGCSYRPSV